MGLADRLCYDYGMKVPFAEKVGYALGDGAANLVFQWYLFHHDSVPSGGRTWLRSLKVKPL